MVTLSPHTSEIGFDSWPGLKWESWQLLAIGRQFTVQNLDQLYVLVLSALPTTLHDMTCKFKSNPDKREFIVFG